jgi:hypothetical protein
LLLLCAFFILLATCYLLAITRHIASSRGDLTGRLVAVWLNKTTDYHIFSSSLS